MYYVGRDRNIDLIKARPGKSCYGMGLGIMILDEVYPGFPGDVRNASAYNFPIQYDIVKGIDIYKLVWSEDKTHCRQPILEAAKRLEKIGCRAVAAECGYFLFQKINFVKYGFLRIENQKCIKHWLATLRLAS
jgi:hypothetical protein